MMAWGTSPGRNLPELPRFSGTYRTESPRLLCSMGMTEDLGGKIGMVGGGWNGAIWVKGILEDEAMEIWPFSIGTCNYKKQFMIQFWKRKLILSLLDNTYRLKTMLAVLLPQTQPLAFPTQKTTKLLCVSGPKRQLCGKKWWQSLASLVCTVLGIQSRSLARSFPAGCRVVYRYVWVLVPPCPLLGIWWR